ncbi:MAG TPA: ABC transporter substrate-binding protein [Anaerolineae bacterium]|nr:ABC transporter substrate-binding protein [Anaerolineae bacterium]
MFWRGRLDRVFCPLVAVSVLLASCGPTPKLPVNTAVAGGTVEATRLVVQPETDVVAEQAAAQEMTPTPAPSTRTGAWVDQLVFTEQNDARAAVKQLQANDIDLYAGAVSDPQLFQAVQADQSLSYTTALGFFHEITANPVDKFKDGRINPFGVAEFREALNRLIDRTYIAQEILGGLALPMVTVLNPEFPDYARYVDVIRGLEAQYAYDPDKARAAIAGVMRGMGATVGADGKWRYDGEPVTLVGIIRSEDQRREIGDYFASQLESAGFAVDRQYKTRSEASPIWNSGDPANGEWSFYTGGWVSGAISRDDAGLFGFYYTRRGSASPLWQAYKPGAGFDAVVDRLANSDFTSMDERAQLFRQALQLSLQDSARIFVAVQTGFSPQKAGLRVAFDLASGVAGSGLFPYTVRWAGKEGGVVRVAQAGELVEPWNPIGGSNWLNDSFLQSATNEYGLLWDPYTGLSLPQRIEKADCVVKTGLPVTQTLDWVTLTFADRIEVPNDAWADWDAKTQTFVEAGEMPTPTLETNTRCTVTYPQDLWTTIKWHDGSAITLADFIMRMIMAFDPGKSESALFDQAYADSTTTVLLSHLRGIQIESADPLAITTYDDQYSLDVELLPNPWWPAYGFGEAPWTTVAIGNMAEEAGRLAWSTDLAGVRNIEWASFIAGPSLQILKDELDKAAASGSIVFTPTLGSYLSPDEIATRYAILTRWYKLRGHFWVGTGPFWLDKAYPVEKTVSLRRFEQFPDPSTKWERFESPRIPAIEVTGPGQVKIGAGAAFDIAVTFDGQPYAGKDIAGVEYLVFDATGVVVATGTAASAGEGRYSIALASSVAGRLTAGSSRLEVVITSNLVSIPGIVDFEFVVIQ